MGHSAIQTLALLALVAGAPPSEQDEKNAAAAATAPIGIWFELDVPATTQGRVPTTIRARETTNRVLGPRWTMRSQAPAVNELVASPPADEPAAQLTLGTAWQLSYRLMREPSVVRAEPVLLVGSPDDARPRPQGAASRNVPARPRASPSPPPDAGPSSDPEWSLGPRGANVKASWEMLPPDQAPGAGVVIAHLDTGVSDHPEIRSRRDGNAGIVDWGYDFVDLDRDAHEPLSAGFLRTPGHGTKTASVIISPRGSQSGATAAWVTGVAPGAILVPLRVADGLVRFRQDRLAAAIDLAAGHGDPPLPVRVDVISIGLGGPPSLPLARAIKRAQDSGILVVAAAGNAGTVVYPARYQDVISVAASNVNGEPWRHSSSGSRVDIAAPGQDVWRASASETGGAIAYSVERGTGTSLAAATVAGAAALWLQKNRGDATLEGLRRSGRLTAAFRKALRTSVAVPAGWPRGYGPGIIDVAALLKVRMQDAAAPDPIQAPSSIACVADLEPVTSALEGSPDPQMAVARLLDTDDPCHAASLAPEIATLHAISPAVRTAFDALAREPRSPATIADARRALGDADASETLAHALRGEKTAQARVNVPTLVWQSANASIRDLPAEILQLYRSLDETGTLRTRTYVDAAGAGIESLMRDAGLFYGPTFPPELDALLCRRNAEICRLEGARPVWTHRAGSTFNLPEMELEPDILPRPHQKRPKEPIRDIAVDVRKGCAVWSEECADFITYLNKEPIARLDARGGTVIIPTFLVRARFTVEEWSRELEKRLGERLVSDVSVTTQGFRDDPHFAAQVAVLELIRHPLAEPDADGTNLPTLPARVGIIDPTPADLDCDFEKDPTAATEKCDQLDAPGDADHATHVAGIIGARINGRGIVGINPIAKVMPKAVAGEAGSSRMSGAKIASSINELINDRVDVVNISMDYELRSPGADGVKEAIKNAANVLFVVAAGNDARDLTDGCDVWPACFANSLPNVLTVVGLDRTKAAPARWTKAANQGSNFSASFHLCAPGVSVLSTLRNGRVGTMTGTSQAAPIVAGAASLIMAREKFQLPASKVRDRLIASSDFFPNLDLSAVGGRLNVWRALEIGNDLLEYRTGQAARGQVRNRSDRISFTTAKDEAREGELRQFLRIHLADDDTHTIVFRESDGRLNKFAGATIAGDPEIKVAVTQADGSERVEKVKLSALRDFTARIPPPTP